MKSLLDKVNAKLNAQGGFLKAVSVLVGGTAFAQLIGFVCLPILTRLYTPEDYSVLGVYVAIVAILAVISCLRFDIAIPIPENESDGKALLLLSLLSNTAFSIFLYLLLIISYPYIQHYKIIDQLSYWIWLIPFGVFVAGFYSALQFWATRHKRFKEIAKTRMTQAISGNTASMAGGVFSVGFGGLIIGQLLNLSGGLFNLAMSAKKDLVIVRSSPLKATFTKYKNFPKYSTFEAFANIGAIHLPLLLIASFIFGPQVGYLMLAMKILGIPMGLIGSAMSQVYLANANKYLDKAELYNYTKEIIFKIFKITILPFLILAISSPYIFGYIFGKEWEGIGLYILAMIPWYFMQILSSPVSMSLHVIGKQKIALFFQLIGFFIRVIILGFFIMFWRDYSIYWYFISGFIFYTTYLVLVLVSLKKAQ